VDALECLEGDLVLGREQILGLAADETIRANRLSEQPRNPSSGALSMDGRSSRIREDACTSSTAAATGMAASGLPHSSAQRSASTARTRFDSARAV
jgi:hypothetical protein